jgi:hypothetical protein
MTRSLTDRPPQLGHFDGEDGSGGFNSERLTTESSGDGQIGHVLSQEQGAEASVEIGSAEVMVAFAALMLSKVGSR